jgi:putative effector of murein hydrolase LrgA (UPF0299 family)
MRSPCPRKSAFANLCLMGYRGDAMKKIRNALVAAAVIGATTLTLLLPAVPDLVEWLRLGTQLLLRRGLPSKALE